MVEREIERICARARQPRRDLQIALRVLLDRCKSREVAEEMGLPPQTIYNVTHRVLEALAVPVEELT